MTWVLYLIGMLALIGIWDVDSKLKKLLRNQNAEEPGGESNGGGSFDLSSLKDKKVKIYLNDDSEVYDSLYLYGHGEGLPEGGPSEAGGHCPGVQRTDACVSAEMMVV